MNFLFSKLFNIFIFVTFYLTIANTTYYRQFHATTEDVIIAVLLTSLFLTPLIAIVYIPYLLISNKKQNTKLQNYKNFLIMKKKIFYLKYLMSLKK